ncbi:hypothetical protein AB1F87_004018 [Vibrio mimicus]
MQANLSTANLSELNQVTCVMTRSHENSPKNDSSLFRAQLMAKRMVAGEIKVCAEAADQRLALKSRLNCLRSFTHRESAQQLNDIEGLKGSNLFELIKSVFASEKSRHYALNQLYDLVIALDDVTWLDDWFIRFGHDEVIIHARFGSVFPGIRFIKQEDVYCRQGFNFDIRLRNEKSANLSITAIKMHSTR